MAVAPGGVGFAIEVKTSRYEDRYIVLVREQADGIVFLHRIAPGSADKSYGIHVARLAGVPAAVLDRAEQVLAELEAHHRLNAGPRRVPVVPPPERRPRRRQPAGPTLFQEEDSPQRH